MRESLVDDIKGGAFTQEWRQEQASGSETLAKLKDEVTHNAMSEAEEEVIHLMQRANKL
jgi:ketol-acid reductoisomerase